MILKIDSSNCFNESLNYIPLECTQTHEHRVTPITEPKFSAHLQTLKKKQL